MKPKNPPEPVAGITTGQRGESPPKDTRESLRTGGVPRRQSVTPLLWLGTLLAALRLGRSKTPTKQDKH